MKKVLIALAIVALATTGAQAMPIIWDVGLNGYTGTGDADTETGVFKKFGITSQTTTQQFDTDGTVGLSVGDEFKDYGNLWVDTLINSSIVEDEGINVVPNGYEVTGIWDNVEGYVSGITPQGGGIVLLDLKYTAGDIDLWFDPGPDHAFADVGGSESGAGGTGFGDDGNDAIKVATLTLVDGIGHTYLNASGGVVPDSLQEQGTLNLAFNFTSIVDSFWKDAYGTPLMDQVPDSTWIMGFIDPYGIQTPLTVPNGAYVPGQGGLMYTSYSNQDGKAYIEVIPEPASMMLLGSGLLGLAGAGFRKKRS